MHVLTWAIVATSILFGAAQPANAATDGAIETFEQGQQVAWSAHDAGAYSRAFAPDADVITALGWHWVGRDDVARNMADGFKLIYARAAFRIVDSTVRPLSGEMALVRIKWTITGARTPDGAAAIGEQHGIETQILQRSGGRWSILAQQDTALSTLAATPSPAASTPAVAATRFPTTPPPVRRCIVARANGDCLVYGKPRPAMP
jgi:uncharacterized protein (TIGR02246 family)